MLLPTVLNVSVGSRAAGTVSREVRGWRTGGAVTRGAPDSGRLRVILKAAVAVLAIGTIAVLGGCESVHEEARKEAESFNPIARAKVPPETREHAEAALRAHDYETARDLYRQMVIVNEHDVEARLGLAEAYLGLGEGRSALTIYESLPDSEKGTARATEGRGLAYLLQHQDDKAIKELTKAVKMDASLWRAWNAMGLYYDSHRQWSDAEASYRKGIEANPKAAALHNNLGFSLLLQRRDGKAEDEFGKALEIDPHSRVARSNLRLALAAQGRYAEALSGVSKKALPRVLNNVGYVAMMRGDYDAAQTYLSRAIELSPSYYAGAHQNLERLKVIRDAQRTAQSQ